MNINTGSTDPLRTLSDKLNYKISSEGLDDTDPEWILFIKDHRQQILEDSAIIYLTGSQMSRYEHKLRWFLQDNKISTDLIWIILELNNVKMETEFVNLDKLYIPDRSMLVTLRKKFTQFKRILKETDYTL